MKLDIIFRISLSLYLGVLSNSTRSGWKYVENGCRRLFCLAFDSLFKIYGKIHLRHNSHFSQKDPQIHLENGWRPWGSGVCARLKFTASIWRLAVSFHGRNMSGKEMLKIWTKASSWPSLSLAASGSLENLLTIRFMVVNFKQFFQALDC